MLSHHIILTLRMLMKSVHGLKTGGKKKASVCIQVNELGSSHKRGSSLSPGYRHEDNIYSCLLVPRHTEPQVP